MTAGEALIKCSTANLPKSQIKIGKNQFEYFEYLKIGFDIFFDVTPITNNFLKKYGEKPTLMSYGQKLIISGQSKDQ